MTETICHALCIAPVRETQRRAGVPKQMGVEARYVVTPAEGGEVSCRRMREHRCVLTVDGEDPARETFAAAGI